MKKLAKKLSILCMMLVACLTLGVATSCDSINGIVGGITSAVEDTFHECDYVEIMYDENNHWNECDCGEKEDIEKHTYSETVTKQATCTVEGEKKFTCLCGYSYTEAIPATGHTLKDVEGKEATCTEDGYTAYKVCENCDYVEGKEVIEAAHKLVDVEAKAPTCTEDGYTAHKACTECDYTEGKEVVSAAHKLVDVEAKAPTCTEDGYTAHKACTECDYTEGKEVLPAAHKLEEKEGKAATCTEDGYTAYKACTECDYVEGKVVLSARGHNLETVEGKAPTCMEDGYKAYQACTECPYEEAKKVIEATGHSLETKAGKEPTCSEEGYTAYKACVNCDYVEGKEVVEKIPHTNEDEDLVCDVCSAYLLPEVGQAFKFVLEQNNLNKTLYFAGEMNGYYYATTELLCEATDLYLETAEGGYYIYFMNGETKNYLYIVVSETYINVKYGETKDVWTYDEKLGAFINDVNGTDYYIGTYKEFNTISASKYSFIAGDKASTIGVSNFVVRPFIDNHTCEEVTDEGKEATCTEAGLTDGSHCGICGKVFVKQEKVEALGHTTEKGTCERCGQTIGGEEPDTPDTPDTPVTGGSADFDTIVTSNANGDSGYKNTYTTTNGWKTVNSAIQAGGSTVMNPQYPVIGPDNTHKAVCLNGKTSAPGKVTSPTLTGGITKLTMNYTKMFTDTKLSVTITITDLTTNAVYTKVVSREEDKNTKYVVWTEEWVLETPVKGKFTIEIVNNCPSNNDSNKDRLTILDLTWEASATQPETHTHTLTATEAKVATCTEAGNSAYWTCSGCNKYFSDAEGKTEIAKDSWIIAATGHTEEAIPAVEATCTATGLTEGKKCTVCGETTVAQVEIPALGHTEEVVAGKAATCTEAGLTEGKKCTVCGETTVAQVEIPALGHTEEVVPAVAATCTETGLTEGKKCSVCEATLVEQTVVEALGHDEVAHAAKEVTCTEIGWDAYETCTRCDYTTYIETAALGHNIQEHDAAAPTCTEPGCKAYETCLRCDYTTYEEIPALGHTEEVVPAVAATCTETGLTEGKKCSVCEATLVEQEEVEALGHKDEDNDGVCDGEGCNVAFYTVTVTKADGKTTEFSYNEFTKDEVQEKVIALLPANTAYYTYAWNIPVELTLADCAFTVVVTQIAWDWLNEEYTTELVVGQAYKMALYQGNKKQTLYSTGVLSGYYGATSTDYAKGATFYVEEAQGGYYLYFMKGATKTYVNLVASGDHINIQYQTSAKSVWTMNTDYNTLTTKIGSTEYYMGTYNEFTTYSPSTISHASNSFVSHLYEFEVLSFDPETTEFDVVFNTNGGSAVETQNVLYREFATEPAEPTYVGKNFAGWYADEDCTIPFDFEAMITANTNVYAAWSDVVLYEVTYVTNGGSAVAAETVEEGKVFTEPVAPTYELHTFLGWYTDEDCTVAYDFATIPTSDITLYAGWEAPTQEEIVNALYALANNASLKNKYTLTGVITSVDTAYSTQYGNVTVTIVVGDMTDKPVQCFRLKGTGADLIAKGDTITVTGMLKNYNGKQEFDAGCTLDTYTKHTCDEVTVLGKEATCTATGLTEGSKCALCDKVFVAQQVIPTIDHTMVNGTCTVCGHTEGEPEVTPANYTHTFASGQLKKTAGNVTLSGQVWTATAATYVGFDSQNGRGFQIGSSGSPCKSYTLSTTMEESFTTIVINSSIASGGTASFIVKVNGVQVGASTKPTKTAKDYTFTLSEATTGTVEIIFTNTAKAFYIKAISIKG